MRTVYMLMGGGSVPLNFWRTLQKEVPSTWLVLEGLVLCVCVEKEGSAMAIGTGTLPDFGFLPGFGRGGAESHTFK